MGGGQGLFGLCFPITVHFQRKSVQELKTGQEQRQDLMQRPWGLLLCELFSLLSHSIQAQLPRVAPATNGLVPPPSVTN